MGERRIRGKKYGKKYEKEIAVMLFGLLFIGIWAICAVHSQNNLPAGKMLLLSPVAAAGLLLVYLLLCRAEAFLKKNRRLLFWGLLLVYAVLLFFLAGSVGGIPQHDQASVLAGAQYFAGLTGEMNWQYFARCNNNVIPAFLLGQIYHLAGLFHLENPFTLVILCNVLLVMLQIFCVFQVLLLLSDGRCAAGFMGMLLMMGYLPVIGHADSGYTDMMSFAAAMLALLLWLTGLRKKKALWLIAAAVVWGVGFLVKATVLISMIAAVLLTTGMLCRRHLRALAAEAGLCLLTVCIILGGSLFTASMPSEKLRDLYGVPTVSYWMGIGLKGNGGYSDNQEYERELAAVTGMEQKKEASWQYIRDNRGMLLDTDHNIRKLRFNFAAGNLGTDDFAHTAVRESFWQQCMSSEGKYFWRFSMVTTIYQYAIYLLIGAGALYDGISGLRRSRAVQGGVLSADAMSADGTDLPAGSTRDNLPSPDFIRHVLYLSAFGFVLYLMLFEANNRQLFNQLGILTCCAMAGWGTKS